MKRISTATAVQNRFVDGNKSTGQKATQFSAEWCNQIQEEIAGLLESNGVTLGDSENQLVALFSKVFTSGFDSVHMSKDDSTMDADGKDLKYMVTVQGQGAVESEMDPAGFSSSVGSSGKTKYMSRAIRIYDSEDNLVGSVVFDESGATPKFVFNQPVSFADGAVVPAGKALDADTVISSKVKSYSGNTHSDTQAYYDISYEKIELDTGYGPGRSKLHINKGNDGGFTVLGVEMLKSYTESGSTSYFELTPDGLVLHYGSGTSEKLFSVARDGNGYSISGVTNVTASGIIRGDGNSILTTSNVDLTQSPYSGYAEGTQITVANDVVSGQPQGVVNVTYASGVSPDPISANTAHVYVKGRQGWNRVV